MWIDTTLLDHGATNGVVYVRGTLRRNLIRAEKDGQEDVVLLVRRLEREVRNIRGVRDMVCNLVNLAKVGGRWVIKGTA
jgi:hypothetical protein